MIPLEKIQKRAKAINMTACDHLGKQQLIQAIQEKQCHFPCFGRCWCNGIVKEECIWKEDCPATAIYS